MLLEKIDLCAIKAIGHNGEFLQVLIESEFGYCVKTIPAPQEAFLGLKQLACAIAHSALAKAIALPKESSSQPNPQLVNSIEMLPVESSNLAAIGYCDLLQVLQVNFRNGTSYRYYNVPARVFDGFLNASSKGRYLNTVIKTQYSFNYQRVR